MPQRFQSIYIGQQIELTEIKNKNCISGTVIYSFCNYMEIIIDSTTKRMFKYDFLSMSWKSGEQYYEITTTN